MSKLIFVYNAGSSKWQLALDIAHKIIAPSTYPCKLCGLTHGILNIRPQWKDFVDQVKMPVEFLHSDEFGTAYPEWKELLLPAVLVQKKADLEVVIDRFQFAQLKTVEDLITRINQLQRTFSPAE
jgi:hypothetical protein